MNYVVDTVIIGAGPSGISCAITLQKNNASNLVVEKKSFPRDKTCGGLVTNKTVKLLKTCLDLTEEHGLPDVFCDSENSVELYYNEKMLTRSRVSKEFRFVKRSVFDSCLARRYKELGGRLLENCSFTAIDMKNRRLTLTTGDTVDFKRLVAADGALSSTRKALGLKECKPGFCVETHIPKTKLPYKCGVRIYFGLVKAGYAWVFPSGNEYCIGLGGVFRKDIRYDESLKRFLESLGIAQDECSFKGAFVPYGRALKQKNGPDDAVFIGDAGGFVDPICGEGLYFAIASGVEAANSVLSGKERFSREFARRTSPYVKIIDQGARIQKIFFRDTIMKRFIKRIAGKNEFVSFYCDNRVSEYNCSFAEITKKYRDYKKSKNVR
ncbi:MAG: geranylgeranyl reductase family protein [Clostridia bacterium]|nr:geranylgeranyl reductase family protein [Clostridia bacterium]